MPKTRQPPETMGFDGFVFTLIHPLIQDEAFSYLKRYCGTVQSKFMRKVVCNFCN